MENEKVYKVFVTRLTPLTLEEKTENERNQRYNNGGPQRNGIYYLDFKEFPVMEVALTEKEFQQIKKNVIEVIS